jgi:S-formylglutathione hydrolase FrmB
VKRSESHLQKCGKSALIFCVSLFLFACHRTQPAAPDYPQITSGVRMLDVHFQSAALHREMPYRVFLPADLAGNVKLQVVYLLHGSGDDFRSWSNNSSVAQFAAKGLILVMPEGGDSYYMNEVEAPRERYEDYITKDLIADVEQRFPARSDRNGRAVIGISMGGFAAVKYALSRPELFGFVGALSPPIDVPFRRFSINRIDQWWKFRMIFGPAGGDERAKRDPSKLALTANPQGTPYIYLTAGEQEPLLGPIRKFAQVLKQRGIAYEFHTQPGGHDWGEWNRQIPGCFASLFQHLSIKAAA